MHIVVAVLLMPSGDYHQLLPPLLRIVAVAEYIAAVALLPWKLTDIHFVYGSPESVLLRTYLIHYQLLVVAMDCKDDEYCHHLDVDLDAVLDVSRVAAAVISRTWAVVSQAVVDEVYYLMFGLALLFVVDKGIVVVVEIVFPDFHRLLNAP